MLGSKVRSMFYKIAAKKTSAGAESSSCAHIFPSHTHTCMQSARQTCDSLLHIPYSAAELCTLPHCHPSALNLAHPAAPRTSLSASLPHPSPCQPSTYTALGGAAHWHGMLLGERVPPIHKKRPVQIHPNRQKKSPGGQMAAATGHAQYIPIHIHSCSSSVESYRDQAGLPH